VSGEASEREGKPTKKDFEDDAFTFTNADLTYRRPSGAILVIDRYEGQFDFGWKTRVRIRG